jgi:hypothetical protein
MSRLGFLKEFISGVGMYGSIATLEGTCRWSLDRIFNYNHKLNQPSILTYVSDIGVMKDFVEKSNGIFEKLGSESLTFEERLIFDSETGHLELFEWYREIDKEKTQRRIAKIREEIAREKKEVEE